MTFALSLLSSNPIAECKDGLAVRQVDVLSQQIYPHPSAICINKFLIVPSFYNLSLNSSSSDFYSIASSFFISSSF